MKFYFYIKYALKSIFNQGWDALINIIGLAVGISICVVVLLYVRMEFSYEKQYADYQRIYRIYTSGQIGDRVFESAMTPYPLADYLRQEIPDVEEAVKVVRGKNKLVSYKGKKFNEDNFYYADSTFFDIFDVPFVKGESTHALRHSDDIVITVKMAKKYFKDEDPIGKKIDLDNGLEFFVTGVCDPGNKKTHFDFDFIASQESIKKLYEEDEKNSSEKNWLQLIRYTYLKLNNCSNVKEVEKKVLLKTNTYLKEQLSHSIISKKKIPEISFALQKIEDIHLQSNLDNEMESNSKRVYVNIFVVVAIIVLFISCVNFINLTTAKINNRIQVLDVEKLIGISRLDMLFMFVVESVLYSFLALFVGLVFVELFLPLFNVFFNLNLQFKHFDRWMDLLIVTGVTFCIGFFSGVYPVLTFTSFKTYSVIDVFKRISSGRFLKRGVLVSIQVLVASVIVVLFVSVYWQMNFFEKKDAGFESDNVVVVERGYALGGDFEKVKNEMLNISEIEGFSACSSLPGHKNSSFTFYYKGNSDEESIFMPVNFVDRDFFNLLKVKFESGEQIQETGLSASYGIVINSKAKKRMMLHNAIGEQLKYLQSNGEDLNMEIKGVVKDFHIEPGQISEKPLVFMMYPHKNIYNNLLIRIQKGADKDKIVGEIKEVWRKYTKGEPFEYKWLDKELKKNLNVENNLQKMMLLFSVFSFFVALLGLKAFVTFVCDLRDEDVLVQYMLGASRRMVLKGLLMDISQYIFAGIVISMPISFFILHNWLSDFNYDQALSFFAFCTLYFIIFLSFGLCVLLLLHKRVKTVF